MFLTEGPEFLQFFISRYLLPLILDDHRPRFQQFPIFRSQFQDLSCRLSCCPDSILPHSYQLKQLFLEFCDAVSLRPRETLVLDCLKLKLCPFRLEFSKLLLIFI